MSSDRRPRTFLAAATAVVAMTVGVQVFSSTSPAAAVTASSGTGVVVVDGGVSYVVRSFTTPGSFTYAPPVTISTVDYLVVGGGGGGGKRYGGGGGGGGVSQGTGLAVSGVMSVVVGAGGLGGASSGGDGSCGADGGDSTLGSVTVLGGGAGCYRGAGRAGGSGGGGGATPDPLNAPDPNAARKAGGTGTEGQGFAGGRGGYGPWTADNTYANLAAGGGGGAGGAGGSSSAHYAGVGGTGVDSTITGTTVTYSGGGGGGAFTGLSPNFAAAGGGSGAAGTANDTQPTAAPANRGGGGGGGGLSGVGLTGAPGGNGGSGVVILRYPVSTTSLDLAAAATSTIGDLVTFTASGLPSDATGLVTIGDGTWSATCTPTSGSCSVSTSGLPVGTHSVTATFAGQTDYFASSSSILAHAVTPVPIPRGGNGPAPAPATGRAADTTPVPALTLTAAAVVPPAAVAPAAPVRPSVAVEYSGDRVVRESSRLRLAANTSGASCGDVAYFLDRSPLTVTRTPVEFSLGSGAPVVSTVGWRPGAYVLSVRLADDSACIASPGVAAIAVTTQEARAVGGGALAGGSARTSFGFTVRSGAASNDDVVSGQIAIIEARTWRLTGAVQSYVKSGRVGALSGTGTLWWWDATSGNEHGGWSLAAKHVAYAAVAVASSRGRAGSLGVKIAYSPSGKQPRMLPGGLTQVLQGGTISLR